MLSHIRQRPSLSLIIVGLASAGVYLTYVLLFPLTVYGRAPRPYDMEQIARDRPWMGAVWVAGLILLFLGYLVAIRVTQRASVSFWLVLAFGLVFGVTLIWLYPVTATDLFSYVMRARVQVVYGANPMTAPPGRFPDDPLLPFVGEWKNSLSPYGPAWELLAGAVAALGFTGAVSGALAYKVVALLAYLVCMAALFWGTGGDSTALLFFAWNPLVLLQGLGNGHNDLVMLAWLVLALVFWDGDVGLAGVGPRILGASWQLVPGDGCSVVGGADQGLRGGDGPLAAGGRPARSADLAAARNGLRRHDSRWPGTDLVGLSALLAPVGERRWRAG
jgi:hypothetical protein